MRQTVTVEPTCYKLRLDKCVSIYFPDLSRTFVQKLIKDSYVLVNDNFAKANYKVEVGDVISVDVPEPVEADIIPEDIPLSILYEDEDVIVVDKPKGMVVHPAPGHTTGTLVNALMYHCQGRLSGINGVLRPGIVHRIDKDTTGAIIACKNDFAHEHIAAQLKEHSIYRRYVAIVAGNLDNAAGTIHAPIGRHPTDRLKMAINLTNGKDAITHYKVLEHFKKYDYIECRLETGRTHQIRVHMASIRHPLLGDSIYNPNPNPYKFPVEGQALHARAFGFVHPRTGEYMQFEAPLPEYFTNLLNLLKDQ
jgi:23S rRNA pseudouridine1911/1915/1917 synthase